MFKSVEEVCKWTEVQMFTSNSFYGTIKISKCKENHFFYKGFMRVGIWNVFYLYRNSQIIPFVFWKRKGLRQDRYIAWRDLLAAIPHGYKEIIQDGNIPLEDTALIINSQKPFTEAKRRFL